MRSMYIYKRLATLVSDKQETPYGQVMALKSAILYVFMEQAEHYTQWLHPVHNTLKGEWTVEL